MYYVTRVHLFARFEATCALVRSPRLFAPAAPAPRKPARLRGVWLSLITNLARLICIIRLMQNTLSASSRAEA